MPFYVFPFRPIASRDTHTSHMRRSIMTRLLLRGGLPSAPASRLTARCVASSSPSSSSRPTTSALPEWRTTTFGGQDRIGTDGALVQDDDGPTHRLTTPGGGLVSCWEKCLEKLEEVQACRERAWLPPRPRLSLSISLCPSHRRPAPPTSHPTQLHGSHPPTPRLLSPPPLPRPAGPPPRPPRPSRRRTWPPWSGLSRPPPAWSSSRELAPARSRACQTTGPRAGECYFACAVCPTPPTDTLAPPPPTLSHKKGRSPRSHRPTPIIAIPFFSPFFHHTARTRPGLSR